MSSQGSAAPKSPRAATSGDGRLHVHFFDVGQGDAALVVAPDGATLLIDGGGAFDRTKPDPGEQVVAPALRRLKISALTLVLMTHPHPDHVRGLFYVAEHWPIAELLHGGTQPDGPDSAGEVERLEKLVRGRGGNVAQVPQAATSRLWHGLQLQFLHPRNPPHGPYPEFGLNDNSVVLHLQWGQRSVLFAADIEKRAEAMLAATMPRAEILKVAHHGNRRSSTAAFLGQVQPTDAVISAGVGNPWGVPHRQTLERLRLANARIWRTDQYGEVHFVSDGSSWHSSRAAALEGARCSQL